MEKKFRTKNQRHAFDDEKRRESLQKKLKEQQSQKELIKRALSDIIASNARKIVFDDEIVTENGIEESTNTNGYVTQKESEEKPHLFEDSDDEKEEKYDIKIKSQFEGKKGHKLLNLQSQYSNDERFKLDERFKDDSESNDEDDKVTDKQSNEKYDPKKVIKTEPNELEEEKTTTLKVLESVLGRPIQSTPETEKKPKKSFFDMVRFDATNEDHKRKQSDVGSQEEGSVKKKKKKESVEERKKRKEEEQENTSKPSLKADKKFYEVSEDLKAALKNRNSEKSQFSLLKVFGKESRSDEEEEEEEEGVMKAEEAEEDEMDNEMWQEGEEDAFEEETKMLDSRQTTNEVAKEVAKVQGITKEKFFFTEDDPRIEEGLTFINMKNSEEAGKAIENYDETRRDIREVLRLRWQKHRQRNNPFKKKIGGSSKQNMPFNKNRKQFGKNFNTRRH